MKTLIGALVTIIGGIAFLIFLSFLLSWPVWMLWNGCLVGAIRWCQRSHLVAGLGPDDFVGFSV
jgi:hypothetical protein